MHGYRPDGQSVAAQVAALRKHGAGKVFREVASGAKTDRAQLRRLLDQLDAGDVLMVTRLDRLARSTRDLLNTLAAITGKKAGFRSLGDTWADTTTAHGRLMLTVLGGLAEFERDLIRARTSEGRERAKARGVKLGRKPKLTEHQKREAIRRRDRDGEPVREIARSYNVSAQHDFPADGLTECPDVLLIIWMVFANRFICHFWSFVQYRPRFSAPQPTFRASYSLVMRSWLFCWAIPLFCATRERSSVIEEDSKYPYSHVNRGWQDTPNLVYAQVWLTSLYVVRASRITSTTNSLR